MNRGALVMVTFLLGMPALASGQTAATSVAGPSAFDVQAALGGGWDDNLNNASRDLDRAAGGYGRASASLGVRVPLPWGSRFVPAARYAHTEYPDYSDLASDSVALTTGVFVPIGFHVGVMATPRVQGRFYADTRRNATDVGGTASVRVLLGTRVSTRVSGSYLDSTAADSVFSRWTYGGAGGAEVRLPLDVFLGTEYAWDRGTDYSYIDAALVPVAVGSAAGTGTGPGSGPGSGQGGPHTGGGTTIFGGDQIAVKGEATMQRLFVDVDRSFGRRVTVQAGYVHTEVDGDFGAYRANGVSGSLTVRF